MARRSSRVEASKAEDQALRLAARGFNDREIGVALKISESEARRKRRQLDGATTDWIVVRNRLSMLGSRNKQLVADGLKELSFRLGFRSIDGFAERVVYREFFPRGLTALDDIDEATLGTRPNLGHVTAREEVTSLLRQLKLPLDERGRRRAANRAEWFTQVDKPLEVHDIIGA